MIRNVKVFSFLCSKEDVEMVKCLTAGPKAQGITLMSQPAMQSESGTTLNVYLQVTASSATWIRNYPGLRAHPEVILMVAFWKVDDPLL